MDTKVIKPWLLFVLLLALPHYGVSLSGFGDTLSAGQSLSESESIISKQGDFELGFFKPGNSSSIYLGIWNKRFVKDVVWVANRENPSSDSSSSRLTLSEDGNLLLLEDSSNITFWSTNLTFSASNLTEAVLGDDGNFVLRDKSNPSSIFWESFDHPTDAWLPGAKLGIDAVTGKPQQLISWKNSQDPAPGLFSMGLDPNGSNQFFLEWNKSQIYWSTGVWNGSVFSLLSELGLDSVYNFSFVSNEKGKYFSYSLHDETMLSKFAMSSVGQVQLVMWLGRSRDWGVSWAEPMQTDVYALCGAFGAYRENPIESCECLQGFEPFSMQETVLKDWSGGCVRRSPLQCENSTYANGGNDWFLKIPNLRLPVNSIVYSAVSAINCEGACVNNCSCTAYAYNSSGCMIWQGGLLNLHQLSDGDDAGQDIFLRLAAAERPRTKGKTWKVWVTVAAVVSSIGLILCLSIYFLRKGKLPRVDEASSQNLFLHDFDIELHAIDDGINSNNHLKSGERKDVELPIFSYESVSKTTNNFSATNKLGEGGFGPVYKGKLFKGHEIAVKMLSKRSGQGIQEFRNEIILIAKLQHRNLVKILGCCIEGEEKILIYEYMPNKSLDFYLFDLTKKTMLDWKTRICIIEGIAQGLLYLHQYSRLRIIHRDLKPSNILLDINMTPKISDFGMARMVGDNETRANTNRIVGTYGYMSPEYATEGLYSIKSDVFSFGVLLLEIISGRKNTGFYNSVSLNLLNYAWELWRDDRSLELMDAAIEGPFSISFLFRLINIGLLCVQYKLADRPTMSDVALWITNEYAPLPTPKQPAFSTCQNVDSNSPTCDANNSTNSITVSIMEPR